MKRGLQSKCESLGVLGDRQWAYRKGMSSNDMLAYAIATWIQTLSEGGHVGLYLGDIDGAFDKVDRRKLLGKLANMGLSAELLDFFAPYFPRRQARVCVGGALSNSVDLLDNLFQGTVFGPLLGAVLS